MLERMKEEAGISIFTLFQIFFDSSPYNDFSYEPYVKIMLDTFEKSIDPYQCAQSVQADMF